MRLAVFLSSLTAIGLSACTTVTSASNEKKCQSDAVIMVVAGETLDRKRLGAYAAALAKSGIYPKTNGYYLNAPRPIDVFEGDVSESFVTLMVRFPSIEAARTFWDSDVYQNEIKPLRLNPSAGDYTVTVYKETELPAYMQGKVNSSQYTCN